MYKERALGFSNEDISNINKTFIIRYLHKHGVCTRAQISKAFQLTPASISKTVNFLLDHDIVQEVGFIAGKKQRRSIGLILNDNVKKVIGVRISRKNYAIGVLDLSGNILNSISMQFMEGESLKDVVDKIKSHIRSFLLTDPDIAAIGVAVPGPFDHKMTKIIVMSNMNQEKWNIDNLRDEFGASFNIPIIFSHNAIAGAMANWWLGTHVTDTNNTLVHYLVGDGVGAGVITDSVAQSNSLGLSIEIGHVSIDINGEPCACGNKGCLEQYCSTFALIKYVKSRTTDFPNSTLSHKASINHQDVFDNARLGDPLALEALKHISNYIGYGAVNIINAYMPNIIVISNEIAKVGDIVLPLIKNVVSSRVPKYISDKIKIVLEDEKLIQDPILYGAGALAINHCLDNPLQTLTKK